MTPYFHNFTEFLAMGEHGRFVWASYGLTVLAIIGLIMYSRSQRRAVYREILNQQARQSQRRNR